MRQLGITASAITLGCLFSMSSTHGAERQTVHYFEKSLTITVGYKLASHGVDPARVYLTGLSMGGFGTWDLGTKYPERFAAIAPVCGGGQFPTLYQSDTHKRAALRSLGVWAFHGAKDQSVPLSESQRMMDLLRRFEVGDAKLTVYPEAKHDSWTETYANPELYAWLLRHRRAAARR